MKFGFDLKKKKGEGEIGVEHLVEKGMDMHERNWKDKFTTKHSAKKEILELKHNQKIEIEDKKLEQIIRLKELELEEKRMQEETERKKYKPQIIASAILGFFGMTFLIFGAVKGFGSEQSGGPGDPYAIIGFLFLVVIPWIWIPSIANLKKNKK